MADIGDEAALFEANHLRRSLSAAKAARAAIPAGVPGECSGCGYDMPRLVNGLCGFCRDGRRR